MSPKCLCNNTCRVATYDEAYSAISNRFDINGFRCRRACSVPSLMFHRVNRTSRHPRGWFGVVGQAPLPRRGVREGDPFCVVQSLCGLGLVGLGAVEPQCAVAFRCKKYCPLSRQFDGGEYQPVSTPRRPPVAEPPGAMMRFQFAGVRTSSTVLGRRTWGGGGLLPPPSGWRKSDRA